MTPTIYEIYLRGEAPAEFLSQLGEARQVPAPVETVLVTDLVDQDGLHRLITRIRDLGLELRGLRCLPYRRRVRSALDNRPVSTVSER